MTAREETRHLHSIVDVLVTDHPQVSPNTAAVGALLRLPRWGVLALPTRTQRAHTAQQPAAACRRQSPPGATQMLTIYPAASCRPAVAAAALAFCTDDSLAEADSHQNSGSYAKHADDCVTAAGKPGCSVAMQASAAQCKAEACPKTAMLRQLLGAVAAGEAALEEVAPTRYNLVRLVLVSIDTAAVVRF